MKRRKFLKNSALVIAGTVGGIFSGRVKSAQCYQAGEFDLLIKGGFLIDPANNINQLMDVAVKDGVVAAVEQTIPEYTAKKVANAAGYYVSPGFIDIHVHSFVGQKSGYGVDCSENGRVNGATTVVDAGTSGAADFETFMELIRQSKIRMLAFVNISNTGMAVGEQDPSTFNIDAAANKVLAHPEVCVGIKTAHYWASETYDAIHTPWASVDAALAAARACKKPAMFDVQPRPASGNWPARSNEVLLLEKLIPGDIRTHGYHNTHVPVLDSTGKFNQYIQDAQTSGRIFDLGHGSGSFYWANAKPGVEHGYIPNSISTDLHITSIKTAYARSMPWVMSKILALGVPFEDVIRRSTVNPANEILRPDLGRLTVGHTADISIFDKTSSPTLFLDVRGYTQIGDYVITNLVTIYGGKVLYDGKNLVRDPVTGVAMDVPKAFGALWNYPNPFNISTTVVFELDELGMVDISIYNSLGQRVRTLSNGLMRPGHHELIWNGRNNNGETVTSGVYLVNLRKGAMMATHEILLLK